MIELRDKAAIIAGDKTITYQILQNNVKAFSETFSIEPGERVLIYAENSLEWIYAFYAVWHKQGIPVPVDHLAGTDDVSFIIDDCKPAVVFTSQTNNSKLLFALEKCNYKPEFKLLENNTLNNVITTDTLSIGENSDDTAVIIYTSGTTGSPKGVMLSYTNLIENIESVTERVKIINGDDRLMILLPLHHIFPLLGTLILPLYVGATTAICPSLNAEDVLKTLQTHKISIIIAVPRFYELIYKGIMAKINKSAITKGIYKLAQVLNSKAFAVRIFKSVHQKFGGSVRHLVAGGAALNPEIGKGFKVLGFDVLEGYGMTEAAPMITFTRPGKLVPGSAGQAVPGVEVKIEEGEILARGKNIMKGYYKRPEETNEILKNGWLYTGDLGRIDEGGRLFITGRKKEILVTSNGKNINPSELEIKLLNSCKHIKEVAVFLLNDSLQCLIVPDLNSIKYDGIEDYQHYFRWDVIDKLNKVVSPYKRIMKFYLSAAELPKTRLGKIQRYKLPEIAQNITANRNTKVKEPEFTEYVTIKKFLEDEIKSTVLPNDHLEMDLGLDSLGRVTLIVMIENRFGVKITEESLGDFVSVEKIAEHVRNCKTKINTENINWTEILKEKIQFKLPNSSLTHLIFSNTSKFVVRLLFKLRGKGLQNIPDGPCIIAPNHQSFFDGFFVASFFRRRIMKNTYVYAKEKHWRRPWLKFVARKNNIILMDINKDLKISLQKMALALRKGKKIIIFPEGTRSKDGSVGQFKKTFAILSQELDVPVIPVAINGSYETLPHGKSMPRFFRNVSIEFLKPVSPKNHNYESLRDFVFNKVAENVA